MCDLCIRIDIIHEIMRLRREATTKRHEQRSKRSRQNCSCVPYGALRVRSYTVYNIWTLHSLQIGMSAIDYSPVWCGRPSYMAASHATWPQGITTLAVRQCKPTDCIQFHIIACSHDRHTDHRATAQTALLKKLIHVVGDLYYCVTNVH